MGKSWRIWWLLGLRRLRCPFLSNFLDLARYKPRYVSWTSRWERLEPSWILGRDSSRLFSTSTGLIMAPRLTVWEMLSANSPYWSLLSFDRTWTGPIFFFSSLSMLDVRICFREQHVRPDRRGKYFVYLWCASRFSLEFRYSYRDRSENTGEERSGSQKVNIFTVQDMCIFIIHEIFGM